jgi:Na+-translocating ferredoxin:NAD+ oxidoreductase RNF subunit RnfB
MGRAFVNEKALGSGTALEVMDYERATEVIRSASHIGVGTCYCRHKMKHLGKACGAPLDICLTFNSTAGSLIKHGIARQVDVRAGLSLLDQAQERNLVQFGENVREEVAFMCNCCGCCCEALLAAKRFSVLSPIATTNFLPEVEEGNCNGCGKCVEACPVEAMSLVSAGDPRHPKRKKAKLQQHLCLGCGVCVRTCDRNSLSLRSRGKRVLTPVTTAHRTVLMAIERGKLQNLIFDNQAHWSHRAMAAILGAILKLPPVQQIMASRQMKSIYLDKLLNSKSSVPPHN